MKCKLLPNKKILSKIDESLESDINIYLQASDLKCKLSSLDVEEFTSEKDCLDDLKEVYEYLNNKFGIQSIKYWKYVDGATGFRVIFNNFNVQEYTFTNNGIELVTDFDTDSHIKVMPDLNNYTFIYSLDKNDEERLSATIQAASAKEAYEIFRNKCSSCVLHEIDGIQVPIKLRY